MKGMRVILSRSRSLLSERSRHVWHLRRMISIADPGLRGRAARVYAASVDQGEAETRKGIAEPQQSVGVATVALGGMYGSGTIRCVRGETAFTGGN
jgi:hypothetical protein